jgi:hypothetical protein
VLVQSVPEGCNSRSWALEIDVEPAMAREEYELDEVIEQVHTLVHDHEQPELEQYDFAGIEPGEHSIAFRLGLGIVFRVTVRPEEHSIPFRLGLGLGFRLRHEPRCH